MLESLWQAIITPIQQTPWSDLRGFWLEQILDDRFVVIYFLPLVPLLLLWPRQHFRTGLLIASVAFIVYLFGVAYAAIWLATCLGMYALTERFAIECRRPDVKPAAPPLVAGLIIGGWYIATMVLHELALPTGFNTWLFEHVPWIYPLGARGLEWEPAFRMLRGESPADEPVPLIYAMFWNIHNIGTAYLAIRMFQYLAEIKRGTIPAERRTRLNFLAFTCYGPLLIQGPIERYADFHDAIDDCHRHRGLGAVPPALYRIAIGILKSLAVTWYLLPVLRYLFADDRYYGHPERIESNWLLVYGVAIQIFALYLEFSGYCDVAIGMSRLLGYRVIENFNKPWLATSMRDFWRRWHISLSALLRDYVYIPLGGNRHHALRNVCLTFFLIGIWHALIPQVGVWGVLMGLMVAVNQNWVAWMKHYDARPESFIARIRRAAARVQPVPTILAWLITQHAFVFSLLVFFGGNGALRVPREIFRRLWDWLR
jgi:D-alanyl-lipoteichoic acid acyltransferase DltB (MBOAT superfamily)